MKEFRGFWISGAKIPSAFELFFPSPRMGRGRERAPPEGCPFPQRGEGGQGEGSFWGWCARGVGIEKALAVRRGLRSIHYSKKSIRVDFVVETPELESDRGQTSGRDGDFARAIDGKSPMEWTSSASALRAEDGGNSPGSDVGCRRGTTSRMGTEAFNRERERPNDPEPLSLSTPVGGFEIGGAFKNLKTIPLDFPNVAHSYWDNFRLTGEYYIKPTRLTL